MAPSAVLSSWPVSVDFVGTRTFATLSAVCARVLAVALAAAPLPATAAPPAPTDDTPPPDPDDPNVRFERAESLYRAGRYEEAIEVLEGLLREYPEPILYFNLGRAHESSGRIEDAITAYERYLQADPDAPDTSSVRDRISRLEDRRQPHAPVPRPPTPAPPPPAPRPIVAPWVLAGIGGAGLAVGVTFAGLSRARSSDARDAPDQVTAASEHDAARRHAVAANVAFGVGGALLVAGLSWGIAKVVTRRRQRSSATSSRPRR